MAQDAHASPTTTGTTPGEDQARFPGFDVLAQASHWDQATRQVVQARLVVTRPRERFFTADEFCTAASLCDLLLDQHDEPRVPVAAMVERRLAEGSTDGWRYADLPEDGAAWRRVLAGLDADAQEAYGAPLHELSLDDASSVVAALQHTSDRWHDLPAAEIWSLLTRYACTAYYSHPWAWNEIGFSGPAYPRGYKNIGRDRREPWEVRDHLDLDPVGLEQSGSNAGAGPK